MAPVTPFLRTARLAGGVAGVLAVVWLGGFLWFTAAATTPFTDPATRTDAIVVLTGGSERIATGLALLAAGLADRLFISGVGARTRVIDLLPPASPAVDPSRITLGTAAVDTVGNAAESAAWARQNGIRTIRLVTAAYHMPRALVEFRAAMPDVVAIAHPVFPDSVRTDWWRAPRSASLLAIEYTKFLLSRLRIAVRPATAGTPP
jgi:uncharacterized SAM-binding protein YcdF (DUF218 family)